MGPKGIFYFCAASLLGVTATGSAAVSKEGYTWFNPTPDSLLREFTTDRPDFTESPFTVDAGHAQLEMDFARFTGNSNAGERERAWEVAPFNLRLGILNQFELGFFLSPFACRNLTFADGHKEKLRGFGDVTVRAKINFTGNEGEPGQLATGLIVDVTLPTSDNGLGADRTELGVTLPVDFDLPFNWHGGAMTRIEFLHDRADGNQRVWSNSLTLGHELTNTLSGYFEFVAQAGTGTAVTFFSGGAAWKINAHTQLDAGVVLGWSRAADDLQLFSGISRRF